MRKQSITAQPQAKPTTGAGWLPLAQIALVEITSEQADHPVEAALLPNAGAGWRAAAPGAQLLRLRFDTPQRLQQIRLHFVEVERARTQEFILRYSRNHDQSLHELVRQQWNFSPHGATRELEEYQVNLSGVTTLELAIIPDIAGGDAYASLAELRLA